MSDPISVLIVDDSAFMRQMIPRIVASDPAISVTGTARNGYDALSKLETLKPDVITLDIEMPEMDGIDALKEIMARRPTAVIMVSSLTQAGADITMRCLELGAVDFVGKPGGAISLNIENVGAELIAKIKMAATIPMRGFASKNRPARPPVPTSRKPEPPVIRAAAMERLAASRPPSARAVPRIIVIGSSTGGPRALQAVIPRLPAGLNVPILIVQHMPPTFTTSLAKRLDSESAITVREAAAGDRLQPGVAIVAAGGHHLEIDGRDTVSLTLDPPVHAVRPSVDVTIASVVSHYGGNVLAVLLTGMGRDGALGLKKVRDLGGMTIAEDESTCVVFGMPKAAYEMGAVERLMPLHEIAEAITRAVTRPGLAGKDALTPASVFAASGSSAAGS